VAQAAAVAEIELQNPPGRRRIRHRMKTFATTLVVALKATLFISAASAENWPHWRGPHFNGSSTEEKLPDDFSKTNNVKWVAPMPGPSASTPIIWGNHVFVSSTDLRTKTLRAIALDRKGGKELWNNEVAQGFGLDNSSNFASPSPVTDGKVVYFVYGTGDVAAFDFAGKKLWSRDLQKDYGQFAYQWTYGASPTLFDRKLYIQVLQRDVPVHGRGCKDGPCESYLLALSATTGKELWRHVRPSDAPQESKEAYSTPIPIVSYVDNGRFPGPDGKPTPVEELPIAEAQLLISGGDCLTAHDWATGKEVWRWGNWNPTGITHWRLVPSPVVGGRVALVCAPKGSPVFAVKLRSEGKLDDSAIAWKSENREVSSDVATPLFYQGKFYVLNGEKKILSRIDPRTGNVDWIGELGTRAKIESSPTGADGKIYFQDFRGTVFVVEAGEKFNLLRTIPMGDDGDDKLRSTIPVSQGNLFIRTGSKLYCVGGK
jgi:outer membrane protein assembly factor BamB